MQDAITYIGLGSNLGDKQAYLKQALAAINAHPQMQVLAVSPFFRSAPVGVLEQPDFVNAVAQVRTHLAPYDLLAALQAIENAQARVRTQVWGPRTLDLDILLYADLVLQDKDLCIPHAHMRTRGFVLLPLYTLNPELCLPTGELLCQLLSEIDTQDLQMLNNLADCVQ
ncbi:2-amino-4-hydroxy-6-hydroxymethyldihydropteridinediphosphokinase [Allopseudospirillum japonicum]|uniref:2-amino-4-hydroxy-6-hydroxymethyldihydropteridine pyrophosphokinase n=1 Tax=Allopseudospirillum japonicum TaxID=64971 RepID=A0A1H6SGI9_9GAMM|nr:2-amino-4-hydroxy-6-hydroxymethyldihydropteridine diphosphokinase [Allopseudospirillum japonicum]SEI67053.1 2-amino-4-hydroxy-6-hydroxymethyldihydropteridinediphosphokinase [Allopseudospirillum japonicum]